MTVVRPRAGCIVGKRGRSNSAPSRHGRRFVYDRRLRVQISVFPDGFGNSRDCVRAKPERASAGGDRRAAGRRSVRCADIGNRCGGPAARAGVRSTTRDESGRLILGDIIIELAGEQIQDSSDLYRTLDKLSVGETVDVTLLRGVDKVSARVTLDDVKDMKPPTASTIVIPMRTKKSPNSPY